MIRTKEDFKTEYSLIARAMFRRNPEQLDDNDKFAVLAKLVEREADERVGEENYLDGEKEEKKVYYFSMEFLIGKLMENYLLNLGIRKQAEEGLAELGTDLEKILEVEPDPGLGNGGLARHQGRRHGSQI